MTSMKTVQRALAALALGLALAGCQVVATGIGEDRQGPPGGTGTATSPALARAFAPKINGFRQSQGRRKLAPHPALMRAAQAHADDMARRGYLSHRSPGGQGPRDRIYAEGICIDDSAENIARWQTLDQAFQGWLASPGHRRGMLTRKASHFGIGRRGTLWVLLVAAPMDCAKARPK